MKSIDSIVYEYLGNYIINRDSYYKVYSQDGRLLGTFLREWEAKEFCTDLCISKWC